jgi:hypothetical protein
LVDPVFMDHSGYFWSSWSSIPQLENLLYTHSLVLWRGVTLNPEQQFVLTNRFDLTSKSYGWVPARNSFNPTKRIHAYFTDFS